MVFPDIITGYENFKDALDIFKNMYNERTYCITINLLKTVVNSRLNNVKNWEPHLYQFSITWIRLSEKSKILFWGETEIKVQPIIQAIIIFKETKATFLICSSLESMNGIVINLTIEADLLYDNTSDELLYYARNKDIWSTDIAYYQSNKSKRTEYNNKNK